jgi:cell pole-organizing protein PopZ
MSGPHADQPPPATGRPAAGDASMDDILASIRRILNDEDTPPDIKGGQTMAQPDPVLQLDPAMMVGVPDAAPPYAPAGPMQPDAVPQAAAAGPAPAPGAAPSGIVAPEAAAAAAQSVGSLVRTLTAERAMQVHSNGPTIEDIVRAEIRPILKHWLDTNLPPMVERLVRAEIERVVGRAVP